MRSAHSGLEDPSTLPSARVLAAMAADHENSFVRFVREQSLQTQKSLLALPFTDAQQAYFADLTQKSIADQKAIEAADTMPFELYREQYVSPRRLGIPAAVAHTV